MFLMWLIGLALMLSASGIFYYYHKNYGVPYEQFRFDNSSEFGLLAPKDWDEHVKFRKIEAKAELQGVLVGKPVAWMFLIGMVLFIIPTCKFLFRM